MVPKPRAWMLDCDYYDKLSPEEQRFLAQFNDEFYRMDFRYERPTHPFEDMQKERYNAHNANQRDVYSRAQATGQLYHGTPTDNRQASTVDLYPSPEYLDSAEYKDAVVELRKLADIPVKLRKRKDRARIKMLQSYIKSQRNR